MRDRDIIVATPKGCSRRLADFRATDLPRSKPEGPSRARRSRCPRIHGDDAGGPRPEDRDVDTASVTASRINECDVGQVRTAIVWSQFGHRMAADVTVMTSLHTPSAGRERSLPPAPGREVGLSCRVMATDTITWSRALARYAKPAHLQTLARRRGFTVIADGPTLRVTPDSSGIWRPITQAEFDRSLPLFGRTGHGELQDASWNSSYIEAIVADLRT